MHTSSHPWLTPSLLRPKRLRRLARNAVAFYLLSKPLRRPINPRREALRRRYAPGGKEHVLDWQLRDSSNSEE